MIVVSGLLVALALVLLGIGLTVSLDYVYLSIGVSVLAFLVLGLVARQRRAAPTRAADPAPADPAPAEPATQALAPAAPGWQTGPGPTEPARAAIGEPRTTGRPTEPAPELPGWQFDADPEPSPEDDDDLLEDEDALGGGRYGGTVLVVPGRPRYHVVGCRYLLGRESADLDVLDAREEGFRPCGICRPDVVLAEELSEVELVSELRQQRREVVHLDPDAALVEDELDLLELPDDGPFLRRSAPARPAAVATAGPAAARAAARLGAEPLRRPGPDHGGTAMVGSGRVTPAPGTVRSAPVPARPVEDVVLVPGGRFHRPGCRYARDVASARPANADAARGAGQLACGICKP